MMFSNVIVAIDISCCSFVLNPSCVEVPIISYFSSSILPPINESYLAYLHEFLVPAVGNNSQWLLCYRASLHGWEGEDFHTRCDGKKYTVTVIKKNQYVFGGYTDVPWGK